MALKQRGPRFGAGPRFQEWSKSSMPNSRSSSSIIARIQIARVVGRIDSEGVAVDVANDADISGRSLERRQRFKVFWRQTAHRALSVLSAFFWVSPVAHFTQRAGANRTCDKRKTGFVRINLSSVSKAAGNPAPLPCLRDGRQKDGGQGTGLDCKPRRHRQAYENQPVGR